MTEAVRTDTIKKTSCNTAHALGSTQPRTIKTALKDTGKGEVNEAVHSDLCHKCISLKSSLCVAVTCDVDTSGY